MTGETWIALRSYVFDSRLYCDITRLGVGGRTLLGIPVIGQGGGPTRGLFVPPTAAIANAVSLGSQADVAINEGAQVVVIWVSADAESAPRPQIIGTTGYVQTNGGEAKTADGQTIPGPTEDSVVLQNAGGSLIIDGAGIPSITPATNSPARIELGSNTALQVRRTGAADDHLVLNTPYQSLTNEERTSINNLGQALQVFSVWAQAIGLRDSIPAPPPYVHVPLAQVDASSAGSAAIEVSADRVMPS